MNGLVLQWILGGFLVSLMEGMALAYVLPDPWHLTWIPVWCSTLPLFVPGWMAMILAFAGGMLVDLLGSTGGSTMVSCGAVALGSFLICWWADWLDFSLLSWVKEKGVSARMGWTLIATGLFQLFWYLSEYGSRLWIENILLHVAGGSILISAILQVPLGVLLGQVVTEVVESRNRGRGGAFARA